MRQVVSSLHTWWTLGIFMFFILMPSNNPRQVPPRAMGNYFCAVDIFKGTTFIRSRLEGNFSFWVINMKNRDLTPDSPPCREWRAAMSCCGRTKGAALTTVGTTSKSKRSREIGEDRRDISTQLRRKEILKWWGREGRTSLKLKDRNNEKWREELAWLFPLVDGWLYTSLDSIFES